MKFRVSSIFRNTVSASVQSSLTAHSLGYKTHHVADLETPNILQINRYEHSVPHINGAHRDLSRPPVHLISHITLQAKTNSLLISNLPIDKLS